MTSVYCVNPDAGRAPGLFDPANVMVGNGTLQMVARHATLNSSQAAGGFGNYTTSALHSTDKTDFGYFEVRSRSGSGMVSSSWWFHDNNGTYTSWFERIAVARSRGCPDCSGGNVGQSDVYVAVQTC